jgi:hypothetical protein
VNRFFKTLSVASFVAGASVFCSPSMLVAQMSQGGLDAPAAPAAPAAPSMDAPATQPAAEAGEMIESPFFTAWKGRGVGSTVTYTMTVNQAGQTATYKMTSELKEITDSKATLQQKMAMGAMGGDQDKEQSIDAKVPADRKWQLPDDEQLKWTEAGTEKVTVNGKEYDCTKLTTSAEQNGATMKGTAFYTAEVPGGIVKVELDATSPMGSVKISMVADSFESK